MARHSVKLTVDKEINEDYLSDISKVIKYFYETPVIFLTKKDYSDIIFDNLCAMRKALEEGSKSKIIDIIVDFHLQWLQALKDLDLFSSRSDVLREEVCQAISYTLDATCNRLKYYERYMSKYRPLLSNESQTNLIADVEIIEDMHKEITQILLEKLKCFNNFDTDDEFKIKLRVATDELYSWIDYINDELAMQMTKYISTNVSRLREDLTKTLQQIVNKMQNSESICIKKSLQNLKETENEMGSMIRCTRVHNLEISILTDKITILDDEISNFGSDLSSAPVKALQHKKQYLKNRLDWLENLKITLRYFCELNDLQFEYVDERQICICKDFYQLRIFNHALPPQERERLVTELCYIWDLAIFGERSHKSIISILSAADMKEEFTDDLGTFYIDQHSRKIYKLPDDEALYQPNEQNELVPLADDSDHIYFFDECGRYFFDDKTRQRVYKAYKTASEYMMDSSGVLLKVKEQRDDITYYYDNYGRYYVNADGIHIYREEDSTSEYENDGFGNLVRIRSHLDIFKVCPDDMHVTEDFKYLKITVGKALRESIADVIIHQPTDPIKYLSARLVKYRENMELNEKRCQEKEELEVEREIKIAEERAAAEHTALEATRFALGGSEASYDSNVLKYDSMNPDDFGSVGVSSIH